VSAVEIKLLTLASHDPRQHAFQEHIQGKTCGSHGDRWGSSKD